MTQHAPDCPMVLVIVADTTYTPCTCGADDEEDRT